MRAPFRLAIPLSLLLSLPAAAAPTTTVAETFDLVAFVNRRIVAAGRPADVFHEETLRATYGPRMALVRVGDRYYAIDVGSHAEDAGPEQSGAPGGTEDGSAPGGSVRIGADDA